MHETNPDRIEENNRQFNKNNQRFQYSTFNHGLNDKADYEQESGKFKVHYKSTRYRTHHSAETEYTFFSIINETFFRNILQDR